MTDTKPDRAWLDQRLRERGVRKKDIAALFEVHPNMVHKMLNGERRVQIAEVKSWSSLLGVSFIEAMRRFGFDVPPTTCPLIGTVDGLGRVRYRRGNGVPARMIAAPETAGGNIVALQVDAPRSAISIYDGSCLYFEPSDIMRVDAVGRLSVIAMEGEPVPVIGVLARATLGRGSVSVYGGIELIETNSIVSATPIVWQRFG